MSDHESYFSFSRIPLIFCATGRDLTCLQSNIELLELSREKWLIDNKYYSAEVSFLLHLTDKDSATGLSQTADDFDGVIYIVPSREEVN